MTWLKEALILRKAANRLEGDARASFILTEAERLSVTPKTLNGQIAASGYIAAQADRFSIGIKECRSSVMAIEALQRLERRAPAKAADVRIDVLKGRMTHRAINALCGKSTNTLRKWRRASASKIADFADLSSIAHPTVLEISPLGLALNLDAELQGDNCERVAMIISEAARSDRASANFSAYLMRVFSALSLYPVVLFVGSTIECDSCWDLVDRAFFKITDVERRLMTRDPHGARTGMAREAEG